jgi:hypothetical protein
VVDMFFVLHVENDRMKAGVKLGGIFEWKASHF